MLEQLHVKNLALIDEEEISFYEGLNILSGETGAGKSIILGAISLALGEKVPHDFLRDSAKEGLVEIVFSVNNDMQRDALSNLGIEHDGQIIMSRKITESRSVAKINGEMVPANLMKKVGEIFIDIYGQHEHQSLLDKKKHLEMLDFYAADKLEPYKKELASAYSMYMSKKKEFEESSLDDDERTKEILFLEHEISEIEAVNFTIGEDEQLEEEYRKMNNSSKIVESVNEVYNTLSGQAGVSDLISRALRDIIAVSDYDDELKTYVDSLNDMDSVISDVNRGLSTYISGMDYDPARFSEVSERLNALNLIKDKYGKSLQDVLDTLSFKRERLDKLKSYDDYLADLKRRLDDYESQVDDLCSRISQIRHDAAVALSPKVCDALRDLNFLDVHFDVYISRTDHYGANGFDECEFLISTNPGESAKPLRLVASGGELSRIMLALKTVLVQQDTIDTMIFDEIDTGISGKTAQALSEKLSVVSRGKQVIAITHLPQVAAMADHHYLIEKGVVGLKTVSGIRRLNDEERVDELSRMLAGSVVSDAVRANAKELLEYARG